MSAPVDISIPEWGRRLGTSKASEHGRVPRHEKVHNLDVSPYAQVMITTCWIIGRHAEFEELPLRPWTHMLGFRRHFATKAHRYSTTFSYRSQARQNWRSQRIIAALGYADRSQPRRHRLYDLSGDQDDQDTIPSASGSTRESHDKSGIWRSAMATRSGVARSSELSEDSPQSPLRGT